SAVEDGRNWEIRYGLDTAAADRIPFFRPPDLFAQLQTPSILEAELVRRGGGVRYRTAIQVPNSPPNEQRIRLFILLLLGASVVSLVVFEIVRRYRNSVR